MKKLHRIKFILLLLSLLVVCSTSCKKKSSTEDENNEKLKTQVSENLTYLYSVDGKLSYRFSTPLLERYELAKQPYTEFRKGVHVVTYNDSTHLIESELTANYAIYREPLDLWEAKGNVVARNAKGQVLETEQLFWDKREQKIYSQVESRVTQGEDEMIGDGFESDEKMDNFIFRSPRGRIAVENSPLGANPTTNTPTGGVTTTAPGKSVATPATPGKSAATTASPTGPAAKPQKTTTSTVKTTETKTPGSKNR